MNDYDFLLATATKCCISSPNTQQKISLHQASSKSIVIPFGFKAQIAICLGTSSGENHLRKGVGCSLIFVSICIVASSHFSGIPATRKSLSLQLSFFRYFTTSELAILRRFSIIVLSESHISSWHMLARSRWIRRSAQLCRSIFGLDVAIFVPPQEFDGVARLV